MKIRTGCDIVRIKRFSQSAERGGKTFLEKIFLRQELAGDSSIESLAGMFAVKEAVIKALGLETGDWHNIEIVRGKTGRPRARLRGIDQNVLSHDISISHDGEYVIAIAGFLTT